MKFVFLVGIFFTTSAFGATWIQELDRYFQPIVNEASPSSATCQENYQPLLADGRLEIRFALGYFDNSAGNDLNNQTPESFSKTHDAGARQAIEVFLTRPCSGRLKLCGFKKLGGNMGLAKLHKKDILQGKAVEVLVYLTSAAASTSHFDNIGRLAETQTKLSQQSMNNFFGGIKHGADIVLYTGHSRNGGGPDFQPPILRERDGHPDYKGYYEVHRTAEKHMLNMMTVSRNQQQIIGLFSCYSIRHFEREMLSVNADQKMILSHSALPYNQGIYSSVAYLEGMLRGHCGDELESLAEQTPEMRTGVSLRNWK